MVGLALIILEILVPGLFVFLFFAFGAFAVSAVTFLAPVSMMTQALVFLVTSIGGMFLFRGYLKDNFFKEKQDGQDPLLEDFIDKTASVLKDFHNGEGLVSLNGVQWKAKTTEEGLKKSDQVTIKGKENITLVVKKTN